MQEPLRSLYRGVTALANVLVSISPNGTSKLNRTFRARRGLLARVQAAAAQARNAQRPLLWLHAPSVGEGLQARPVAHAWRVAHPDWQIAYTYFSPSAESFASSVGADIVEYLPFDSVAHADAMLDALTPTALAFAKLDVWPVLVERAVLRGIPVVLISATLAQRSGRLGWWSRKLLSDAYASLARVGAIDEANAARLVGLGVSPSSVEVTGDTRFDQVVARAQSVDRASPLLVSLASTRPTLVAGSTWPADEATLLDAWASLMTSSSANSQLRAKPRLVIAPHEPTVSHCEPIIEWASKHALRTVRLSELASASTTMGDDMDVVVVDRVGVLGELYALADVAFVGGGFHSAGLHSVIEPAAFAVPVVFGPQHDMSREAGLLLDAGGAVSVRASQELSLVLRSWITDDSQRVDAGRRALAVVDAERGATNRTVALIERAVSQAVSRTVSAASSA